MISIKAKRAVGRPGRVIEPRITRHIVFDIPRPDCYHGMIKVYDNFIPSDTVGQFIKILNITPVSVAVAERIENYTEFFNNFKNK